MLSNKDVEGTADALLNGKSVRKTTFGTKSKEGIIAMIHAHQAKHGTAKNESEELDEEFKSYSGKLSRPEYDAVMTDFKRGLAGNSSAFTKSIYKNEMKKVADAHPHFNDEKTINK